MRACVREASSALAHLGGGPGGLGGEGARGLCCPRAVGGGGGAASLRGAGRWSETGSDGTE